MAIDRQITTDKYSIFQSDCMEVMQALPENSIHFSIYSPPFGGLYHYSSSERDLSNCENYETFFEHYDFIVEQIARLTVPGRITAVHCMDVPNSNSGRDSYRDFPGDIIRLHDKHGMEYMGRHGIWKEPLAVRLRTMQKNLAHQTLTIDSSLCGIASMDYLLLFRNKGANPIPIEHPSGLMNYAGERVIPADVMSYRGWEGKQTENRYSHWIWRQYASSFWDDIRIGRVLPYKASKEPDDEKHVHPLQLDVIERCVILRSNPGETVLTPFMGVGSEVYGAVINGRRGIGIELKESYYKQAAKNLEHATSNVDCKQHDLFA